ncbi:hypothetical protein ANN_09845 [Periplaneta americana]|uniref:Mutator-like transposase domain-containing protein n=1 Tax=Periplaneta americana TaxID=6978 RepID=A0ABQ8TMS6_PERAM|nr:hypothetical protein ANN_09845 [Periplaneta americana]
MVMNMSVMNKSTFNDHAAIMKKTSECVADSVLHDARLEVRKAYSDLIVDAAVPEISDISVSFDGTWLTRGHSSMYGVGSVIDLLTGFVLDYTVMSKHCYRCMIAKRRMPITDFRVWYAVHAPECDINHEGSSGAMEAEAALILWKRSEQYGLRYTTILSDGDASTYKRDSDEKPYGASVAIQKEECISHIGKRLGTALRKAVSEWRTRGCKLGGRGHGTLKAMTISKLQKYYQKTILDNRGNLLAMKSVIYATLFHSISTDEKPEHGNCPVGTESWCFYQRAVSQGKQPDPHKDNVGTPLKEVVLAKMMPVYQRLASNTLLERCLKCLTQNANESLHSVIWRHCPKDSFGSKRRVDLSVDLAVCKFNAGCRKTVLSLQEAAGLPAGDKTVALGVRRHQGRVVKAKLRATKKFQHYRQAIKSAKRRLLEAAKRTEGTTYKAGHF